MKTFKILIIGFLVSFSCQAAEESQAKLDKELLKCEDAAKIAHLLESRANPNICDSNGVTPLMKAVRRESNAIALLINHYANPYAVDSQGHGMAYFIEAGERVFGGHGFRSEKLRKSIMCKMKTDGHIRIFLPGVLEDIIVEYCEGSMYWEQRHDWVANRLNRINKNTEAFDIHQLVDLISFPFLLNLDATKQVDQPSIREMIEAVTKKYKKDSGKHPSEVFLDWEKLEECMEKIPKSKRILG